MIKNYFKIAFRNLFRNKGYSTINIAGLAVGMAAAILIFLWIENELSYEGFHKNKNRIYQVWNRLPSEGEINCWGSVSAPTAPAIVKDLPEVERAVRVSQSNTFLLSVGEKKIKKDGVYADTGFFQMFSFPLLKGDPATALKETYSVVLTEKTAKSLFGDEEAIGKVIKFDNKDNFTVTGVLKDLPNNTSFDFEYLLPWSSLKYGEGQDYGWNDNSTPTYVMLKPNASYASAASKIERLKQQYSEDAKK
jgi:hypothetical protein